MGTPLSEVGAVLTPGLKERRHRAPPAPLTGKVALVGPLVNQVDLVLNTKGLHQLDITAGCTHTQMGLVLT